MQQPPTSSAPTVDTPIHEPVAPLMAKNILTAVVLDTSLSCARSNTATEILRIKVPSHPAEPSLRGPVAADVQAHQPAEADSPTIA